MGRPYWSDGIMPCWSNAGRSKWIFPYRCQRYISRITCLECLSCKRIIAGMQGLWSINIVSINFICLSNHFSQNKIERYRPVEIIYYILMVWHIYAMPSVNAILYSFFQDIARQNLYRWMCIGFGNNGKPYHVQWNACMPGPWVSEGLKLSACLC